VNPLQLRILLGDEDNNLLHHIKTLEWHLRNDCLTPGEQETLMMCWERLERITQP
jgi:hypothetical protein